ncbi:hypothetical protein BSLG_005840 [Batrachochytrium salamandrivorans]|nr:hypothetical protein BSLG_005840 [Batrachochytrium salamandrivorans]
MIVDIALIASLAIASVAAHASGDIVKSNALSSVKSSSHRAAVNPTMSYTLGAPLLTGSMSIYYIYYGTWSAAQNPLLKISPMGLDSLRGGAGACALGGTVSDNYTLGKSPSGTNIPDLINTYVGSGALPDDPSGVLPCALCYGWKPKCLVHERLWSFTNANASPNGDAGVDAMLNTVAGQIASAVINPQSDGIRAWQDANGFEGRIFAPSHLEQQPRLLTEVPTTWDGQTAISSSSKTGI